MDNKRVQRWYKQGRNGKNNNNNNKRRKKNQQPKSVSTTSKEPKLDTLGVSVYHLQHLFLQKVCSSKDSSGNRLSRFSTISEIENLQGPRGVIRRKGAQITCPLDGRKGAAYVHCLKGVDHVGKATHMLSYVWSYSIGDIVDSLSEYCRTNILNPKRTYIWICCLCVNQHRVVALQKSGMIVPSKDFFRVFGKRVQKIGHILAMMAPWKAPKYLGRVWCIFEIFTAHANGCTIDIVMPPNEKRSLEQDVINCRKGINALYETLGNTKVQAAKASVEGDRQAILTKVVSDVGYQTLNRQVNNLLRQWMLNVLTGLVESRENSNDQHHARFCNEVGLILSRNGEHDAAMKLHQTALCTCERQLGNEHPDTAITYNNIGAVLSAKGDYDGALAKYLEALDIRLSVVGKNHPSTATSYNNISGVLCKKGDYDGALAKLKETLSIREKILGKNHPDTASTYNNIGFVLRKKGDYEGALVKYQEALGIQEKVRGKNHPHTAATYNNIGNVLASKGDFDGALAKYQEALDIRESVLGKNHPETATTYNSIGSLLYEMGDYAGALLEFDKCLAILKQVLGVDHPNTKACLESIEMVEKTTGAQEKK